MSGHVLLPASQRAIDMFALYAIIADYAIILN